MRGAFFLLFCLIFAWPSLQKTAALSGSQPKLRVNILSKYSLSQVKAAGTGGLLFAAGKTYDISGEIRFSAAGRIIAVSKGKNPLPFAEGTSVKLSFPERYTLDFTYGGAKITRTYSGSLELAAEGGRLMLVAVINTEDYVSAAALAELGSLLAGEEPQGKIAAAGWKKELIASVEISLRSYIAAQKNRHGGKNYQFCDLTHCSHFPGLSNARGALTEGEIMTERRNGNPVSAFFHSACGGVLTGPEVYWNGHAAGYHYARGGEAFCASAALDWSVFLQAKDMEGIIGAPGLEEISLECEQGRVSRIAYSAKGGRGRIPVSLFMSRAGRALGWNKIRSNLFTVKKVHGGWSFDGKGSGHGVGLCMHGAREMARDGKSAREILNFFYVNPVIGRAD